MIESQFEKIDQRAKRVSEYFNPVFKGKKQHPYMREIKGDFGEDSKLYSLDKYMYTSKMNGTYSLPPIVKEVEKKSSFVKKKNNFSVPRRKQLRIESMQEFKPELRYKGSFSITKLLPERKSPKVSLSTQLPKHVESWANGTDNDYVNESIDFSLYSFDGGLKQVKSYPENISSEYIKESFSQLTKFSSKNSKYELSPMDLLGNPKRKSNFLNDVIIKYQTDPNLKVRWDQGECDLRICDINTMDFRTFPKLKSENGFLMINGCKKLNVENEFGNIWGHNFEVVIKSCEKVECYYVSFNKYSKEIEESVARSINTFKDIKRAKNGNKVCLPKITEFNDNKKHLVKNEFNNPITEALMKFRNKGRAFNPESYLAKLSLFETHAYIRERYSKDNK